MVKLNFLKQQPQQQQQQQPQPIITQYMAQIKLFKEQQPREKLKFFQRQILILILI